MKKEAVPRPGNGVNFSSLVALGINSFHSLLDKEKNVNHGLQMLFTERAPFAR